MRNASEVFGPPDRERIANAVAQAEAATSGEIVPVVATVSGRYDRAEDVFGLLTAMGLLAVAWKPLLAIASGGWGGGVDTAIGLGGALAVVALGFACGAAAAARFPELRAPFIPRSEMREEVELRAREQFQERRVRDTAEGTGILIYVSLYERLVQVLGDDAVAAQIPQEDWDRIAQAVTAGMKAGRAADGLIEAIGLCGDRLARHFPIRPGDTNERSNQLTLID
jgi:putative membrane protein